MSGLREIAKLDAIFEWYAHKQKRDEPFSDFIIRSGLIKKVIDPQVDFHD